ncbi:hypothetical protein A2I42_11205 [Salmonella enterica]|uniref:Uncharacterized protein n=1 Tax=Salmonella enterica TaxID=28901 RepID=A0A3V7B3Q7_SALER|nr:hypothetical protein [Salmonella enterica subsp. enterica serovar Redlands]EAA8666314.1 hypothetical protein [Salmonella enterica]EBW8696981.1 hypothetical protein [Salmonella enterica subsp. diarizonae serovar 16:z10:e,n,x,z15]EAA9291429.1 hypothetical protein [Salmonella enterica]EAA9926673.1 hypothetical protein [Salmonella enterica]
MVIILTLYFSSKTTSITLIAYLLLATMPLTTYPLLFLLPTQNKNNIDIDNKNSDVIFNLAAHPNGWDSQQIWRDR